MIEHIHSLTDSIAMGLLIVLMVPLAITVGRMLSGPAYADRFVALDMLTGLAVAMGALTSVMTGRREFLDVSFGLALFGFLGTCALAVFLERNGRIHQ